MTNKAITLITVGTRGDVQPYVALGLGLRAVGYEVRIAAPAALTGLITQHGLIAFPIHSVDPQAFLAQAAVQNVAGQRTPFGQLVTLLREARPMLEGFVEEVWLASQGSDAIIAPTIFYGAQDSAEKLDIPCIYAFLHPILPTSTSPSPLFPRLLVRSGVIHQGTHRLVQQLFWQPFRSVVNAFRKRLGMAPRPFWGPYSALTDRRSLVLLGVSPTVFPKPKDWPPHAHVTGYWFLDEPNDWVPPEKLQAFLEEGAAPIYVGFGSMMGREVERAKRLTLEALLLMDQRAIVASSEHHAEGQGLTLQISDVPHAWLFPKMAAVVHHAGAGTTGAVLRAGVPSVPLPFLGDQPFWSDRIAKLGVGLPANHRGLTVEALTERLRVVTTNMGIRERAEQIGSIIRAEDGVERAVALISDYLARSRSYR